MALIKANITKLGNGKWSAITANKEAADNVMSAADKAELIVRRVNDTTIDIIGYDTYKKMLAKGIIIKATTK